MIAVLSVYMSTNGCVEGQLSSTYVEQFLRKNGQLVTGDPTHADLIIFYACGLTNQREKESLMIIRKLQAKMKPGTQFIVWGCLPKINPQALAAIHNGPVLGPLETSFFENIIGKISVPFDNIERAYPANRLVPREGSGLDTHADPFTDTILLLKRRYDMLLGRAGKCMRYFIRVAVGCTGHCTYCSERCVFGRVRSRPIDKIISEFRSGLHQGYNRFSLIATDLGGYGRDIRCTLADLLDKIVGIHGKYKLILNQVNPFYLKVMFSDLEDIFASGKIESLCSPVQSGSNRILELMGRMHTAEIWKHYMLRINREFPDIQLTTQFMVGFPTETDEDFKTTLRLLDYPLRLDDMYVFKFSPRPRVYASRIRGQISEKTKDQRYRRLWQKFAHMYIFNTIKENPWLNFSFPWLLGSRSCKQLI